MVNNKNQLVVLEDNHDQAVSLLHWAGTSSNNNSNNNANNNILNLLAP